MIGCESDCENESECDCECEGVGFYREGAMEPSLRADGLPCAMARSNPQPTMRSRGGRTNGNGGSVFVIRTGIS